MMQECSYCGKEFDKFKEGIITRDHYNQIVYRCPECEEKLQRVFKQIENADLTVLEED